MVEAAPIIVAAPDLPPPDLDASAPDVFTRAASGDEDTSIPLEISAAVTDLDGSESITDITISGVPEGAVLSAGTDNGNGSWTLSEDQLAGLAITPPADDDNDFRLNVEVTATEFASGNTSTTASELNVSVAGLADGPRVTATDVAGDRSGCGRGPGRHRRLGIHH